MNLRTRANPYPSQGVARNVRELTHDIVSLAQLEYQLFTIDLREGRRQLLIPITLLLASGIVAVGTAAIALILIAEVLIQPGGLSRMSALSIAALIGLIAAAAMGMAGWHYLRSVAGAFQRSRDELTRNITWIKDALKPPASVDSP